MTRVAGHDTLVDTREESEMLNSRTGLRTQKHSDVNNPLLTMYLWIPLHTCITLRLGQVSRNCVLIQYIRLFITLYPLQESR